MQNLHLLLVHTNFLFRLKMWKFFWWGVREGWILLFNNNNGKLFVIWIFMTELKFCFRDFGDVIFFLRQENWQIQVFFRYYLRGFWIFDYVWSFGSMVNWCANIDGVSKCYHKSTFKGRYHNFLLCVIRFVETQITRDSKINESNVYYQFDEKA